jgi:perosamine synthetase
MPRGRSEEEIRSLLLNFCKVKYVFLLKTARSGLYTILKAYNRPGQVLIPSYNCLSVPQAVYYAGYQPRFVDIELKKLNSLPETFEKMITLDTTAVIPTHLFGIPCHLEGILNVFKQKDILVLEDAAPALGAEYGGKYVGCFGDASVISFGGRKVIYGESGAAILTNNEELATRIQAFIGSKKQKINKWSIAMKAFAYKTALNPMVYGFIRRTYALIRQEQMYEIIPATLEKPKDYLSDIPGYSSSLIHIQLDRLTWNLNRRRRLAQIYREQLENHPSWTLPEIPESSSPSWIQFPIICNDKLAFYKHMRSEGVDTSWTYKYSCAESFGERNCPNAQLAAKRVVSLPTTPFITDQLAYQISSKALKFKTD